MLCVLYLLEPAPVVKLSPAPGERDYFFHLDDKEGVSDLYDISRAAQPSPSTTTPGAADAVAVTIAP